MVAAGGELPLDLYATESAALLTSFVAWRRGEVEWRRLLRRPTGMAQLYDMARRILDMRRPGRQKLAANCWRQGSHMAAALPWALPVLRMPAGAPQLAVRWVRWRLARLLGRGQPGATRWAWRRLRAVHGPEQTLARLRFNASAACRSLRGTDIGDSTH